MEVNRINRNAIFPNLLTVGNGVCGFAAVALLYQIPAEPSEGTLLPEHLALFAMASWLVLLGMVFDVFDGKVARLVGASSPLGAQLDSLSDLITFGMAPAMMILRLGTILSPDVVWWQRAVWCFSLAYFLGALLRLARFTVEQEPDESEHVAFKGLPTPGAAGCVASLVIFYAYIMTFEAQELQWLSGFIRPETVQEYAAYIALGLPFLGLVLGFAMVSNRLIYEHIGTRLLSRWHSFDSFVYIVFGVLLVCVLPEAILPALFLGYLVYTPVKQVYQYVFVSRREAASRTHSLDA